MNSRPNKRRVLQPETTAEDSRVEAALTELGMVLSEISRNPLDKEACQEEPDGSHIHNP